MTPKYMSASGLPDAGFYYLSVYLFHPTVDKGCKCRVYFLRNAIVRCTAMMMKRKTIVVGI